MARWDGSAIPTLRRLNADAKRCGGFGFVLSRIRNTGPGQPAYL